MNHDPSSTDFIRPQTENDALDLDQVLAIDWVHPPGLTFRQEQYYMERRRIQSQGRLNNEGNPYCKSWHIAKTKTKKSPKKKEDPLFS